MSVTFTVFAQNSLENIYRPIASDGFNPNSFVVTQSSGTLFTVEASYKTFNIKSESVGVFSSVVPIGTTITAAIANYPPAYVTEERTYLSNELFEDKKYSEPILGADSFNSSFDATSTLFAKIYAGNDRFIASTVTVNAGDDKVAGYAGNDIFYGYGDGGGDLFDGGAGIDISVYRGVMSNYTLTKNQSFWNPATNRNDLVGTQVKDKTNLDGTDGLVNVERLQFTDTMLALDIGKDQTAGSGYMLYKAAFNRTPDVGGLGYWINRMDNGLSYNDVAKNFVNSDEFKAAFGGSNPSVNTLVTKLYNNVLNRTPDAGGLNFWQDKLTNGGWTTADVLGYFSTSAENVTNVTPLIANGIAYQQFVG